MKVFCQHYTGVRRGNIPLQNEFFPPLWPRLQFSCQVSECYPLYVVGPIRWSNVTSLGIHPFLLKISFIFWTTLWLILLLLISLATKLTWPGHSVVFLGKTLYSQSALLHPGVQMRNDETQPWDGLASHPGGSRNTPWHFVLLKPVIIMTGPMGYLAWYTDFVTRPSAQNLR